MYERILVPTDGSDGTERALEHALEAASEETTIHALSVVDRRLYLSADKDRQEKVLDSLHEESEQAVESLVEAVAADDHEVVGAVREGVPHSEIVDYAETNYIDLIVIGTHGRTGRDKLVNLGSVTERVVSNAGRPVLVVGIGPEGETGIEAAVGSEGAESADAAEAEEAE